MADNGFELRGVAWSQVFPFLRLFKTFRLAIHFTRLVLALACVVGVYAGGRVLDLIWVRAGGGVLVEVVSGQSEIDAYATYAAEEFKHWREVVEQSPRPATPPANPTVRRGPFIELLGYESRCFAGAVQGVCTFRWGFGGGPTDPQPTLLGSIAAAGSGVLWLFTQRPCFAVFYGLLHLAIFALAGGAICRHVAIQSARDETISIWEALRFAREKYASLFLAPVVPLAIFCVGAGLMIVGALFGAIPYVGEVLSGLFYSLALLGGFALAMILIGVVLGLHLMWPTIAVEGSDAFDAITHAVGYIGQRAWRAAFYTVTLLLYGGILFVLVRLIALLTLKLAHVFTGQGMSLFGNLTSAKSDTLGKLDAMWHMPAWGDLPLLPSMSGVPFWGTFGNAGLDRTEWLGMVLIGAWVFLVVGLVGAFVVSFFFCGSTQMYFLLRRDVDAVDYEEVYYEEPEEEFPPPAGEAPTDTAEALPSAEASTAAAPPPATPPQGSGPSEAGGGGPGTEV